MTKPFFLLIILSGAIYLSLHRPLYEAPCRVKFLQDFESLTGWAAQNNTKGISTLEAYEGNRSFRLDSANRNSTYFEQAFGNFGVKEKLRRARIKVQYKCIQCKSGTVNLVCSITDPNKKHLAWSNIQLPIHQNGKWNELNHTFEFHHLYTPQNTIGCYFDLAAQEDVIYLDNFSVEFL